MSKERFRLTVRDWQEVHRLPDSWPVGRLRAVLELAEFDDEVEDADVLDMAVLVLQDLDVQKAGELVLQVVFGDRMSPGVRQNLVDDLEDDLPWEQFASVALQAGIFEAMVLLQQVFPNRYGIPDAVRLRLAVEPLDKAATAYLAESTAPDASSLKSLLLRLLAGGMPEEAVLNRLYADELRSDRMPEAEYLLWMLQGPLDAPDSQIGTLTFEIHSSWQWLGPVEDSESWEASGWPDGAHSGL